MSANLQPKAPITVKAWLIQATPVLKKAGIPSARLDAELILSHALKTDKLWLIMNPDHTLSEPDLRRANALRDRRAKREPLAYIRGWVEFYGRRFQVNKHVLIPRPETEEIIELLKPLELPKHPALIDVGTGSGCIAITAKLERPELETYATDISEPALKVANKNSKNLDADIHLQKADLLPSSILQIPTSIITANLPYVAPHYTVTPEAGAEPRVALFANDDGHELIERLLPQAAKRLHTGGYLILESDPWQQTRILKKAAEYNLKLLEKRPFHLVLQLTSG